MISFLEGVLAEKGPGRLAVAVNGVGYDVSAATATIATLPPVGRTVKLFTRMQVRDDAMILYGFATPQERTLFDLLITVTGVGPKVALAFLSALTPDSLRRAVALGDVAALTIVPGVGKKVAQRVVLDLKDKLGGDAEVGAGPLSDVREALLALGLTPQEASDAMAELPVDGDRPVEELLKEALQRVAG